MPGRLSCSAGNAALDTIDVRATSAEVKASETRIISGGQVPLGPVRLLAEPQRKSGRDYHLVKDQSDGMTSKEI